MSGSGSAGLDTLDGEPGRPSAVGSEPAIGGNIARYVVLGRLGAGAMGVVYAAWDPELDRRVAIKLLHPGVRSGSQGRSRLVREAQALAKLSHPNVVGVHDVGTVDDRVFIAMEFVEGITLDAWLAAAPRHWHDVLDVMCEAGRGLAAAHAAGVVHRDFKPENVMVSSDPHAPHAAPRVRVMDFGLARADQARGSPGSQSPVELAAETSRVAEREVSVTRSGATVGTPAYMAPEQHARRPADARSDQFSFCVSLWQGLYRERPYAGQTAVELAANVIAGRLRSPPATVRVPAWLRRAIVRGLHSDPEARWPTMQALLDEIARGRARARLRRPLAAALSVAVVAAGALVVRQIDESARVESCREEAQQFDGIWTDAGRDRVHEVVETAALPDATLTAARIVERLDRDVTLWTETANDTCLASRVDETMDAETHARASWCLEVKRIEIETFLAALADPDPDHVRAAAAAVDEEHAIATCGDAERLAHDPRPPTELHDEVRTRVEQLLRTTRVLAADDYEAALAGAQAALERNGELGWTPLVARSRFAVGELLVLLGRYPEAEQVLETCYFEASRAGALEVALDAAAMLVFNVGVRQARVRDGLRWSREAELLLVRLGDEDGLAKANLLANRAGVEYQHGDYAAARVSVEEALAIRERELSEDHVSVAQSLGHLANVESALDHPERSRELLVRSLAIHERVHGPQHPSVAIDLVNLGDIERKLGRFDDAERLLRRALEVQRAAFGPRHHDIASTLNNLAALERSRDNLTAVRELLEESLAIKRAALGDEHPQVALALFNLGYLEVDFGNDDEARPLFERALAINEVTLGLDHPEVATVLHQLGSIALRQERHTEAAQLFEREVGIRGDPPVDRVALSAARFQLARALWHEPSSRPRALELANAARDQLRTEGVGTEMVEAWIAERAR